MKKEILLFEDFAKMYKIWKNKDEHRKEEDPLIKFLSRQENQDDFYVKDGKLYCNESVTITQEDLIDGKIPFQFGDVAETFKITNCDIKTLEGCPERVGEDFELVHLHSLTSLDFSPKIIGVNYFCTDVNIKDFTGLETEIGGSFWVIACNELLSIKGLPENINKIHVEECPKFKK